MEPPPSLPCLVCGAQCAYPAQLVAELQENVANRLRCELPGRRASREQEALCSACVHLLGDLDDLLGQVASLRRQLRHRRAVGHRKFPESPCNRRRRKVGKAGSKEGKKKAEKRVKVSEGAGKEKETAAAADGSVALAGACEAERVETAAATRDPLADSTNPNNPATVSPVEAALPDDSPPDAETDSEAEDDPGQFLRPASPPDGRALLGLPCSPYPGLPPSPPPPPPPPPPLDADAVSAAEKHSTKADSNIPAETAVDRTLTEPVDAGGNKITDSTMTVMAKVFVPPTPVRKRQRQKRPKAQRPEPAPVPWIRVEGAEPYRCIVCGRQFQYLASIKIHARTHTDDRPHECDICKRTFAQKTTLINHRRLHTGDKPFKCEDCGRTFAQQSYLCVHRRVHSKEKPFCCEQCGKTFKQAYYLNIHKRIHSGEKPYKCDDCDKSFATLSNLYKHQRGHKGERRFCCEHCGKTFISACHLRDHSHVHSGDRPFACEVCGMRFALAKVLARHRRMHTGEKPYVCMECGKSFSRKETLRDHSKMHHAAPVPSPASAAAAAALVNDPSSPDPTASDNPYYMVDVMPVTGVEEALAWPIEVYRTETGVTVYKTVGEDGAALYQTETGEVFREMSGAEGGEEPPPPPPPSPPSAEAVGGAPEERLFEDQEPVPPVLPAYDGLGI